MPAELSPHPAVAGRPLVIATDPQLLDDLLRLAGAAGIDVELANDPGAARRAWSGAPLVLLDAEGAQSIARASLPRHPALVLVEPYLGRRRVVAAGRRGRGQ